MTASDYVESTLYHQREQAMILHNERQRLAVERSRGDAGRGGRPKSRNRVGAVLGRLHALLAHTPVRG